MFYVHLVEKKYYIVVVIDNNIHHLTHYFRKINYETMGNKQLGNQMEIKGELRWFYVQLVDS